MLCIASKQTIGRLILPTYSTDTTYVQTGYPTSTSNATRFIFPLANPSQVLLVLRAEPLRVEGLRAGEVVLVHVGAAEVHADPGAHRHGHVLAGDLPRLGASPGGDGEAGHPGGLQQNLRRELIPDVFHVFTYRA